MPSAAASRGCAGERTPGETLFIDYSGDTVPVINAVTGEILATQIFIASMGASKYTYAEAHWTQTLRGWIVSHIRMLEYLGCVPQILTPDNLKSAIKEGSRHEPEANATYEDMASLWLRNHRGDPRARGTALDSRSAARPAVL